MRFDFHGVAGSQLSFIHNQFIGKQGLKLTDLPLILCVVQSWMKEEKGIIHRGRGAYLRCPVSTAVQFSLRDEGSTEYMCVRGR